MSYADFLHAKSQLGTMSGFEPAWMPSFLFDFQQSLLDWSTRKGKAAVFADCGLGKTPLELAWAENVVRKTNGRVLILTPLAVSHQTIAEAQKFDLSNCDDYTQFFEHYAFVVRELARLKMPGRMTAVHCMDVPTGNCGTDALIDFPGDIIRLHEREGWKYIARYAIWKEPLAVRNRTMAKNLAHKTIVDDSSRCSVASADYLIVFRRRGQNTVPITHPTGLHEYAGERKMPAELIKYRGWTGNQIENRYSHWIWRQYASAFWDDIRIGRVLPFKAARDSDDEKHVHPLQLDVIERVVTLWSNPGETVLTPFMGVGSEVYVPLRMGRRGIGVELKPSYYRQALKNIAAALDSAPEIQGDLIDEADVEFDPIIAQERDESRPAA